MSRFELDKNSYSRYLGRNFVLLIELSHSLFNQTYRFINDTKVLIVDGLTFNPYPFDIILPSQTETQGTQIVLSNVQNLAANAIQETIYSNENILLNLYFANRELQTAEKYDAGLFEIQSVSITPESITGTLNIRHNLNVNLGSIHYYQTFFENLFL